MSEGTVVDFEFELEDADIQRVYRWMFLRPQKSRRVLWFMWAFGFLLPALHLGLVLISDIEFPVVLFLITLIFPVMWIIAFIGNDYWARHYLKSTKLSQGVTQYRFTTEGLRTKGQSSESFIKWDAYREAYETKRDFILMISAGQFTLIPKRALASGKLGATFRQLLRTHIPKVELQETKGSPAETHSE